MDLKDHIRSIPDFPKKGILFYDISTLLAHADAWQVALGRLAKLVGRDVFLRRLLRRTKKNSVL